MRYNPIITILLKTANTNADPHSIASLCITSHQSPFFPTTRGERLTSSSTRRRHSKSHETLDRPPIRRIRNRH